LFDVTWKVVTDYNLNLWTFTDEDCTNDASSWNRILGSTLGRSGTNGKNTVTVTTLQNTNVTSTRSYIINVTDTEKPTPIGKFAEPITMNLDATGNVIYTALQFNNGSFDNCTDPDDLIYEIYNGTSWGPSISFDCKAIGTPVNIQFRVTDQSGNTQQAAGNIEGLEVLDVTPPTSGENSNQPKGPYCAPIDAGEYMPGDHAYTDEVSLSDFAFTPDDNCGVTRIRYKRDFAGAYAPADDADWIDVTGMIFDPTVKIKFYEGITTVRFQITDGDGALPENERNSFEQNIFIVTVLPKPAPGGGVGIK
jgi:hypothetical protein